MKNNGRPSLFSTPGFRVALLCVALILAITLVLPEGFKTWFVEPSGNIHVAPVLGPLLALGILLRNNLARLAAALLFSLVVATHVNLLFLHGAILGPGISIVLGLGLLYLLLFSRHLREYVATTPKSEPSARFE